MSCHIVSYHATRVYSITNVDYSMCAFSCTCMPSKGTNPRSIEDIFWLASGLFGDLIFRHTDQNNKYFWIGRFAKEFMKTLLHVLFLPLPEKMLVRFADLGKTTVQSLTVSRSKCLFNFDLLERR